jgi:hypothetical protein
VLITGKITDVSVDTKSIVAIVVIGGLIMVNLKNAHKTNKKSNIFPLFIIFNRIMILLAAKNFLILINLKKKKNN